MTNLSKVLIAPRRYVQGSGAIGEIGKHISLLGKKVLVVGDEIGLAVTSEGRKKSFAEFGITQVEAHFRGECSYKEINRLIALAKDEQCEVIIGSGGGKTIDTVKVVAMEADLGLVIVPTIASSDAPCSALAIIYTEEGVFEKRYVLPRNPDIVLVDTTIISQAPVRFLVAGMGDALATWFEADACQRSCALNLPGGHATAAALTLTRLCFDILMEYGLQAKLANEMQVVTPALEKVVEANILLSGLGFESGGLAAAHLLQDGLTVLEEIHAYYHGEKVAFNTLVQMILEERSPELLKKVYDFCFQVGLPITLEELGIDKVGKDRLMEAVHASCLPGKLIYHLAFPITEKMVYDAIITADKIGQRVKQGLPII
ncbi:MAG: glycerol dehydrogenase [Bacillota bacterium]|nr:glycerol dehydrogenase [Bacillota bacterium]